MSLPLQRTDIIGACASFYFVWSFFVFQCKIVCSGAYFRGYFHIHVFLHIISVFNWVLGTYCHIVKKKSRNVASLNLSVTGNSTAIYRKFFNDTPYCIWYQMKEGSANYQIRPFWQVDGSKQKFYDSTKTSMCLGKLTCHWATAEEKAEEKAQQLNLPLVPIGLKGYRGREECSRRGL